MKGRLWQWLISVVSHRWTVSMGATIGHQATVTPYRLFVDNCQIYGLFQLRTSGLMKWCNMSYLWVHLLRLRRTFLTSVIVTTHQSSISTFADSCFLTHDISVCFDQTLAVKFYRVLGNNRQLSLCFVCTWWPHVSHDIDMCLDLNDDNMSCDARCSHHMCPCAMS